MQRSDYENILQNLTERGYKLLSSDIKLSNNSLRGIHEGFLSNSKTSTELF